MPNWCHCTLTVRGEGQAKTLAAFVERVAVEDQPLSFATIVPEPSAEEYAAMDAKSLITCHLCAGTGYRPRTEKEASKMEAPFIANVIDPHTPDDQRIACNGCKDPEHPWTPGIPGTGKVVQGSGAWYEWRCDHWGTKWDASFGGPFMALGNTPMDLEASVASQGATLTPTVVIFKFDTAWSPPVPFVEAASAAYPDLEFEIQFGEVGGDFAGRITFVAGVTTEEVDLDIEDVLMPEEQWF